METDEAQMSKRTRMANGDGGGGGGYEAAARKEQQDEDEEDGEGGGGGKAAATPVRFLAWQQQLQLQHQHQQLSHASRICRVSRASGGKDRHSKVFTAKGLRDRRVRLSVPTAIQFYDLQDRLGYDQPSKAVEWLIKSASAAISELPSLDAAFAQMSGPLTDTKYIAGGDGGASERGVENHGSSQQHQHMSLTKSACSSNSDTSKGSVLSLSRSESRVKARERAKERATTKEKDKGGQENGDNNNNHDSPPVPSHHQTAGLNSHSSFTELLTFGVAGGAGGGGGSSHTQSPLGILQAYSSGEGGPTAAVHKQIRQLHPTATTADYFNQSHSNPFTHDQKPNLHHHQPQGFTAMPHFTTNTPTIGMLPFSVTTAVASAAANGGGGSSDHHNHHHHHHHEIHQQYPFLQDHHLIPTAVTSGGGDFGSNLSFSISSGLAGFNRGTLQSNSTNGSSAAPHLQQHLQRLSASQVDGSSNLPFFFGAVAQPASASGESPFAAGFDARLQLYYGDGYRSSDLKGKEKS